MSLRRRVLVLLALMVVVVVGAMAAVGSRRAHDDELQRTAAFAAANRAIDAMRLPTADFASVAAALGSGAVGACTADGTLLEVFVGGVHRPGPAHEDHVDEAPPPPPPDVAAPNDGLLWLDRDAVQRACRTRSSTGRTSTQVVAPGDHLFVVVEGTADGRALWVLVRHPRRPRDNVAALALGAVALLVLVLGGSTAHALQRFRAAAAQLTASLDALSTDLSAPVPHASTAELVEVGDGIRRLATNLQRANDVERKLRDAVAHGERLASLGRVVAGVAHEVRNPLTGMKLALEGMQRRGGDERQRSDIALCLSEIERLEVIVNDLLAVARAQPVDVQAREAFDVATLVDERISLLQPHATAHEVLLLRSGEGSAYAQRSHVVRVVDNLVRNAIDASPRAAVVTINISASNSEVEVTVIDGGPGVEADQEAQLFEPFFTRRAGGTGLGLFVSRALITAQGGRLEYRRDDGLTRFRVTLPGGSSAL